MISALAQSRLARAVVSQEQAKSVLITFTPADTLTLWGATILGPMKNADGTSTIQVTYSASSTGSGGGNGTVNNTGPGSKGFDIPTGQAS